MADTDQDKVLFVLQPDKDGYPPYACESVWATKGDNGRYHIDNIPFFTHEATFGDVIETTEMENELWFSRMVMPSSNSLVRVIYFDTGTYEAIRHSLEEMGCAIEHFAEIRLISVNIPIHITIDTVRSYLQEGFRNEILDYQEAILRQ